MKRSEMLDINSKDNKIENEIEKITGTNNTSKIINPYFQNKFTKAEVFDFKSLNDTSKILYTNETKENKLDNNKEDKMKTVPSSFEQFNNFFLFKTEIPFEDDINKIFRFAKYVAEKEGLIVDVSHSAK